MDLSEINPILFFASIMVAATPILLAGLGEFLPTGPKRRRASPLGRALLGRRLAAPYYRCYSRF